MEAALKSYKKVIDQNVASARELWKELLGEYEKERASLTDGQGSHPRALEFLDQRAKDSGNTVFFAWKYLTFDDTAGLQRTLDTKRHLMLVDQQDEEERHAWRQWTAICPRSRVVRLSRLLIPSGCGTRAYGSELFHHIELTERDEA